MRHPTKAAIDSLSERLKLAHDQYMQDWEIECADPHRVEEFIEFYGKKTKDDDEKFTLMGLILGSFEEYHSLEEPNPKVWKKIKDILDTEKALHHTHIEYYQCLETEEEEDFFPITKLMKTVEIEKRSEPGSPYNSGQSLRD